MSKSVEFVLITPEGIMKQIECDCVNLVACDNASGEQGGSIGIHGGHLPAVIALEPNSYAVAKALGSEVFRAKVAGGFARVKGDVVTVITEKAEYDN